MRDFHDQKDLFKTIQKEMGQQEDPDGVNWVQGHCYTIDRFLKFMAIHGYTLQKASNGRSFENVHNTIRESRSEEVSMLLKLMEK